MQGKTIARGDAVQKLLPVAPRPGPPAPSLPLFPGAPAPDTARSRQPVWMSEVAEGRVDTSDAMMMDTVTSGTTSQGLNAAAEGARELLLLPLIARGPAGRRCLVQVPSCGGRQCLPCPCAGRMRWLCLYGTHARARRARTACETSASPGGLRVQRTTRRTVSVECSGAACPVIRCFIVCAR